MDWLWAIVVGFFAGIIAKLVTPGGPNPRGFILTTVLGIVGALLATWLGQAINLYDANNYILKVTAFLDSACANYAGPKQAQAAPERCHAWLGPNQPGVTTPDPTAEATQPRHSIEFRSIAYFE